MSLTKIYFVYDGQCPICQLGANYFTIRQSVGELETIDARSQPSHPIMEEINQAHLSLDDGMIIKYNNKLYHGKAALAIMANLSSKQGWFNRLIAIVYSSQTASKLGYPILKGIRNLALKIKGVSKINNLLD